MKKVIRIFSVIIFIPFFIIVNPITIAFWRRLKQLFLSAMLSFGLSGNPFIVSCKNYPDIRGGKYIKVKGSLNIGYRARIECYDRYKGDKFSPRLIFHKNVALGDDCHIGCINRIEIGQNTLIGSKVLIMDHSHGGRADIGIKPVDRPLISKGEIIIGSNVWIGESVCILPNVKIGDNAIIGAGTVVTKDVPANAVLVGSPSRNIEDNN